MGPLIESGFYTANPLFERHACKPIIEFLGKLNSRFSSQKQFCGSLTIMVVDISETDRLKYKKMGFWGD